MKVDPLRQLKAVQVRSTGSLNSGTAPLLQSRTALTVDKKSAVMHA